MQPQPPQKPQIKQRSLRIPLDYYKGRDRMARLRLVLVLLAPLLALGWWFGEPMVTGDRARLRYSKGEISNPHAIWETSCEVCHDPFKPMNSDVALASFIHSDTDQKCTSCHQGPSHHTYQLDALTPGCAECHRDHRGRDASLLRMADTYCTNCHSNTPASIDSSKLTQVGSQVGYEDLNRFDRDHPEFGVRIIDSRGRETLLGRLEPGNEPKDPSNLKFNHKLHLQPGLGLNYTFAKMREEDREHYGWTDSSPLSSNVQLDCKSCHVLDSGDLAVPSDPGGVALANYPPRSSGSYMLPIVFENHCRACHSLTVGVPEPNQKPLEVPHGKQPDEVRRFLERAIAEQILGELGDTKAEDLSQEQLEALELGKKDVEAIFRELLSEAAVKPGPTPEQAASTLGQQVVDRVERLEQSLYQGHQTCTECHLYEKPDQDPSLWEIKATDVPTVWFRHGGFDHSAHRAVRCAQCHAGAKESTISDDILLFGQDENGQPLSTLQVCQQCHSPAQRSSGDLVRGGVDFSCVECHRYHNGEHPLQGLGAVARTATHERSIGEFLRGVVSSNDKAVSAE